ncbi:lysine transporter LysE [Candidatus Aerophobetes bacterium]|nr:MAG: lysine transporter LysE [Candidatus Aerophobetes bacterium]
MISPGPDFAIVTQYGLKASRKAAFFASCGVAVALIIHVLYCVTGVALFLNSSPRALLLIKFLGGIYLSYLGIKSMLGAGDDGLQKEIKLKNAFAAGFFCNLLNPKATVFLLSLFGIFAKSMNTLASKFVFGMMIPILAIVYFSFLSYIITHPKFLPFLQKKRKYFTWVMGAVISVIGVVGIISAVSGYIKLRNIQLLI